MGGLYLDKVVIGAFIGLLRLFFYLASSKWERTKGLVTGRAVEEHFWYSSVKLHYKFEHLGVPTKAWDVHSFTSAYSAKEWASSFHHNHPVIIRVNPADPGRTRFFEVDQEGAVRDFGVQVMKAVIAAIIVVFVIVLVVWVRR